MNCGSFPVIASAVAFFCLISIAGGSLAIRRAPSILETAAMSFPPSSVARAENFSFASPSRTVTLSIKARAAFAKAHGIDEVLANEVDGDGRRGFRHGFLLKPSSRPDFDPDLDADAPCDSHCRYPWAAGTVFMDPWVEVHRLQDGAQGRDGALGRPSAGPRPALRRPGDSLAPEPVM